MIKKSFKIKGNLAEALGDTVTSAKNNAGQLHIEIIPLRKVMLDPDNPRELLLSFDDLHKGLSNKDEFFERKSLEKESLKSLSKSVIEQGVINPIIVYKDGNQYRLIAGERRTLAAILAKKEDIPARILESKPDPLKLSLLQWIENIEREDLSLWERLRNLEKILLAYAKTENKTLSEITPTNLSHLIGCSLQQAVNYCHLLNAPPKLKKHIELGEIKNIEKAALIAKSQEVRQTELTQACLGGATLSQLKQLLRKSSYSIKADTIKENFLNINLGSVKNINVLKIIINSVLENKEFQHLSTQLGDIRWDDPKSLVNSFKQLVKLLEFV